MHCDTIQHATTPTPVTDNDQTSTLPGQSHAITLTGNRLNYSVDDRRKHESTVQQSHEEIHTAEWIFASGPILH
jgi:hypothetical protein